MESLLFRTGSGSLPVQTPPLLSPPRHSVTLPIQDSAAGGFSGEKSGGVSFPKIALHTEMSRRNIRRVSSEPDLVQSPARSLSKLGSRSFTAPQLPEVYSEDWQYSSGLPGGGQSKNGNPSGGGNGSDGDQRKIGKYYTEMLRTDPTNSLLLRNYGKYLHEVERDVVKAEEYYERAILASPGDGEVLSLYAKLTWETKRDKTRASCYFNQALQACPNDCAILGSYAHFLWEAEEGEDDEETVVTSQEDVAIPAMVEAF